MGFLDRIREAQQEPIHKDWMHLQSEEELSDIMDRSYHKPQIIFKHSIRCGVSSMAKHQLENAWNLEKENVDMYYLDLITYRSVSNRVAESLAVTHQSPQIIIINQGKAVFDTSHHAISVTGIRQALNQLQAM